MKKKTPCIFVLNYSILRYCVYIYFQGKVDIITLPTKLLT